MRTAEDLNIIQLCRSDVGGLSAGHCAWNFHLELLRRQIKSKLLVNEVNTSTEGVHYRGKALNQTLLTKLFNRAGPFMSRYGGFASKTINLLNGITEKFLDDPKIMAEAILSMPSRSPIENNATIFHLYGIEYPWCDDALLRRSDRSIPLVINIRDKRALFPFGYSANLVREFCRQRPTYINVTSTALLKYAQLHCRRMNIVGYSVVPPGVDLETFYPHSRQTIRQELFLPQDALIVAFAADRFTTGAWFERSALRDGLEDLAAKLYNKRLIAIGLGARHTVVQLGKCQIRFVPYLFSKYRLAKYYQAADVYLHAQSSGAYSTAVMEAQACGVPVVAMRHGEIEHQVLNGKTGILVAPNNPTAVADALLQVLSSRSNQQQMAVNARAHAKRAFDLQQQTDRLLELYGKVSGISNASSNNFPVVASLPR